MKARIYPESKTATQSGRGKTGIWILEYDLETPRRPEPLMGWTSAEDTLNQVRIPFTSCEDAENFARNEGIPYTLLPRRRRHVRPRNYGDNFVFRPVEQD